MGMVIPTSTNHILCFHRPSTDNVRTWFQLRTSVFDTLLEGDTFLLSEKIYFVRCGLGVISLKNWPCRVNRQLEKKC